MEVAENYPSVAEAVTRLYRALTDLRRAAAANDDSIFIKYRDVFNGYREDDNKATQGRFTASLEGNVADWDYNLAATLNTNHVQDFLAQSSQLARGRRDGANSFQLRRLRPRASTSTAPSSR